MPVEFATSGPDHPHKEMYETPFMEHLQADSEPDRHLAA